MMKNGTSFFLYIYRSINIYICVYAYIIYNAYK